MTDTKFEKAAIPATSRVGRKPLPNPFTEVFPSDTEAVVLFVEGAPDSTEAKRIVRQVRAAAKAVGRSGRTEMEVVDGRTKVLAWTVEAIVRKDSKKTEAPKATVKKVTPAKKAASAKASK